ncbi:esterase-like activity of phytase family protein [Aquabacter sp. L1I39]|uniref:esterase-like activity of phytase family protein n=1 Tax=Aquabacter sp. L1I39 TaxID=2820278 RepID=UPI001ADB51C5|nr:esterase-like activity of phytase family protein [Aquabacter sp. L1I39]QTL04209.1 esterase-like activity of phytase family protein [Aquabacter sp. L1I39]
MSRPSPFSPRPGAPALGRRRFMLGLAAAGLMAPPLALSLARAVAKPAILPVTPLSIEVTSIPIDRFRAGGDETRFGALTFLGGLRLASGFAGFGGLSGLRITGHGEHVLALTDAGLFLSGQLETEGVRPVRLSRVRVAAMLDETGRPLAESGRADTESLAVGPDGIYVGIEGVNEVWRFPGPDPLGQRGVSVHVPEGVKALANNRGMESLAVIPSGPRAGTLIAIGEAGTTANPDLPGFLIGGPRPGRFLIKKSWKFNATDADVGPDGRLYLLERHYSPSDGVSMQIRRFEMDAVRPGSTIDGEVLIRADMGFEIDNMEGLSVTTGPSGETLLTLISDDNFSPLQRTVLLRFALA